MESTYFMSLDSDSKDLIHVYWDSDPKNAIQILFYSDTKDAIHMGIGEW